MRRNMVVLLAGSAIACAGEPTAPEPFAPAPGATATAGAGSWVARKEYMGDIFEAAGASVTSNGRTTMYVIGGIRRCCLNATTIDAVKAYDATANTWRPKAPYPVRVWSTNGAVVLDGKIYVTGGRTPVQRADGYWDNEILKSLYVYTPSLDRWVRKRDMPIRSATAVSVGYQGKLYVATENVVLRYDPSTDQWAQFGNRPHDFWNPSGGLINGKLYLVSELGPMGILDLTTGAWTSGPNRPYRTCSTASTTLQAKLYLFGFCSDYPTDPEIRQRGLVFDPATNSWSEVAPPPAGISSRAAIARVVVNGRVRLSLVQGDRPNNHYQYVP
jgi:N-acetylneuraminic acid mutarotase